MTGKHEVNFPLQPKIHAAQNLGGKYLSFQGGDLVPPHMTGNPVCV